MDHLIQYVAVLAHGSDKLQDVTVPVVFLARDISEAKQLAQKIATTSGFATFVNVVELNRQTLPEAKFS